MDVVFYDGRCALCHGAVRFFAARDPEGARFRFAPLGGATFRERAADREFPDSLVVETERGEWMVKSRAVAYLLRRTGGGWGLAGRLLGVAPAALADLGYDAVARVRRRWFRVPDGPCPILPPHLRERFDP
ncbi:MAG: thiol-disulfide oxidoreductase DCC family protein [Bryobacteraceae bacterium]